MEKKSSLARAKFLSPNGYFLASTDLTPDNISRENGYSMLMLLNVAVLVLDVDVDATTSDVVFK